VSSILEGISNRVFHPPSGSAAWHFLDICVDDFRLSRRIKYLPKYDTNMYFEYLSPKIQGNMGVRKTT